MLISFLALIGLLNGMLGGVHNWLGGHHIPFSRKLECDPGVSLRSGGVAYRNSWHSAHQIGNLWARAR